MKLFFPFSWVVKPVHLILSSHNQINGQLLFLLMVTLVTVFQVFGEGFSLLKVFEAAKEAKASSLILGTHHYVQMSEMSLDDMEGMRQEDLSGVTSVAPVGASVPIICADKMMKIFPNLMVGNTP